MGNFRRTLGWVLLGEPLAGCGRGPLVFDATTDESARASILAMSRGMDAERAARFPRVCEIAALDASTFGAMGMLNGAADRRPNASPPGGPDGAEAIWERADAALDRLHEETGVPESPGWIRA